MPDASASVRLLRPDEAAAFRAIRLEALEQAPEAFGSMLEDEAAKPLDWFRQRLDGRIVFGAFAGAALVGIAGFYAEAGGKKCHKGVLWGVYVRPAARGSGVARRLAEAVIDHARGRVEILQLAVVTTNAQARGLYTSLGFVEYGVEQRALKLGDAYFDEALMAKPL
ncbi:MAG: GNAT family N-acetyltransferase [Alphaproteobacteria bacterium]|nr:GNAT family N-acetyltransferase [Alphaproteobacteria bacterium]